jgi:hypothetical protein
MNNLKSQLERSGFGIIILLLIIQFSCTDQSPLTPSGTMEIQENHVVILKSANPQRFLRPFSRQKWIDDDGGSIWLGDSQSGYSGLVFPEEALDDDTFIEFYWESEGLMQADFYPDGLDFEEPVYIRLSYKEADLTGIDENDLKIYYYNPQSCQWEPISGSTVHTSGKYVDGHIYHFSRYAIGDEQ